MLTTHNTQTRKDFRWLFALATVIALALPYLAFGASPSFRSFRSFRPSNMDQQQSFLRPFDRFGFFGVDELGGQEVIIQQFQFTPITEPSKPAEKGIYVQPHWVDGGYGVQVLEPGHWTELKKEPGR